MALGLLLILFIFLSAVGGVGIIFLFWVQNPEKKKWILYYMALLGMAVAALQAFSLPSNYIFQQLLSWAIGFLSVAAVLIYVTKCPAPKWLPSVLVSTSVIVGIFNHFF